MYYILQNMHDSWKDCYLNRDSSPIQFSELEQYSGTLITVLYSFINAFRNNLIQSVLRILQEENNIREQAFDFYGGYYQIWNKKAIRRCMVKQNPGWKIRLIICVNRHHLLYLKSNCYIFYTGRH